MHRHVVVPEIVLLRGAGVCVGVTAAAAEAVEVIVAALQRTESRQRAQVPLPDERRAIAGLPQPRRERGMLRRQTDVPASQRLFQPEWQSILVAAGGEREAGGRTDGGVRV